MGIFVLIHRPPRFQWTKWRRSFLQIGLQTNTASTPCMKAVRHNRGRGGEEENARRSDCVGVASDSDVLVESELLCNCEKK